jgi:dTDP-4-amino-4,6-dideoxygalactose transaminase
MIMHWSIIPRYHPQICLKDILKAAFSRGKTPSDADVICHNAQSSFFFDSATSCLTVMLQALDLPIGSGVAVPMYSCVSVFEAVAAAKLKCVFIDLDPKTWTYDSNSLEMHKNEFKAVILIHLFGFVADVVELQRIIGHKPIIEDCSHAFGSADSQGNPVGHTGTASIFSFNIHKPLSAGGGGLLVINDIAYLVRVKRIYASTSQAKDDVFELLKLMVKILCFHPMIYGLLTKLGLIKLRRLGSLRRRIDVKRISNVHLNIICSKLGTIYLRWKKQWHYAQNMAEMEIETPVKNLGHSFWNAYLFPVLIPNATHREQLWSLFNKMGIDAFELWPECINTATKFGYNNGRCDNTEKLVKQLFFIPCYAELTPNYRNRILRALSQAKNLGWL